VFIVCCDRTGREHGIDFGGASAIIDPGAWGVATPNDDGLVVADVELRHARIKARGRRTDALADGRPELYSGIAGESVQVASVC
jgi:predicted amidohydrolase